MIGRRNLFKTIGAFIAAGPALLKAGFSRSKKHDHPLYATGPAKYKYTILEGPYPKPYKAGPNQMWQPPNRGRINHHTGELRLIHAGKGTGSYGYVENKIDAARQRCEDMKKAGRHVFFYAEYDALTWVKGKK